MKFPRQLRRATKWGAQRGLTLIELLMILGVIGLLGVGLLWPEFEHRQRRKDSPRLRCMSNLKQLSTGLQIWLHDNDDKLPWEVPPNEGGCKGLGSASARFQVFSNYLLAPKTLACPGLAKWRPPATSWNQLTDQNLGYASAPSHVPLLAMSAPGQPPLPPSGLFSDLHIEGGKDISPPGFPSRLISFDLSTLNTPASQIRWATTNHAGNGQLVLADGAVVAVDSAGLARQLSLSSEVSKGFHLLLPR